MLNLCAGGFFLHGETNESVQGVVLEAVDPLEYEDQIVTASKNAVLTAEGIILNADRIIWDRNASLVRADGSVSLGVVGYRLLAESLILDLTSGTFTAEKVKTGMFPWVIEADQMIASDSNHTLSMHPLSTRIMTGFLHLSSLTAPLMTLTAPLPSLKESD